MKLQLTCDEAEEFLAKKALTQAEANKILECKHCEAPFRGRVLRNLDFNGKDLQNKNFAGTFMENINLQNSDCRGVNFYSTMMINIDFSNANLQNTIFSNTHISHSSFESIKAPLWKKVYLFIKNRNKT